MGTNIKPDRLESLFHASTASFQGNISSRVGNIRAVTLDGRLVNSDKIHGADAAIQEVIEETFGEARHSLQLESDRKAYEPRGLALTPLDKMKDTPK